MGQSFVSSPVRNNLYHTNLKTTALMMDALVIAHGPTVDTRETPIQAFSAPCAWVA